MIRTYIALGSNLDNPLQHINNALIELKTHPSLIHIQTSKIYRSTPLGTVNQPDYINAVSCFDTELSAHDLLTVLQHLESQHGRTRSDAVRWGPRTLDLDILLYGDHIIHSPCLIIPHPEMMKRNFVLYPLADINPELIFPEGQQLSIVLEKISQDGLSIVSNEQGVHS
ncbi:MAG: 2-amino-4-hydroxy-6-hydroxymethyldihydropteridine diphosphokinase [Legionellales bacterium]|nr:2-amino-4-hydroxy-6-hydroxymethyldihydropteridine diphosphokinase [Legionellales bacterium]